MARIKVLTICFCILLLAMFVYLYRCPPDGNAAKLHNDKGNKLGGISMSNIESIGIAIRKYADDHKGIFPTSLGKLYPQHISDLKTFENPAKPTKIRRKKGISPKTGYKYMLGNGRFSSFGNIVMLYEKHESRPGGKYVLFVDGDAKWISNKELSTLLANQTSFVLAGVTKSPDAAMFEDLKTGEIYFFRKGKSFKGYVVTNLTSHSVTIKRKSDSKKCKLKAGELLRFTGRDKKRK